MCVEDKWEWGWGKQLMKPGVEEMRNNIIQLFEIVRVNGTDNQQLLKGGTNLKAPGDNGELAVIIYTVKRSVKTMGPHRLHLSLGINRATRLCSNGFIAGPPHAWQRPVRKSHFFF